MWIDLILCGVIGRTSHIEPGGNEA